MIEGILLFSLAFVFYCYFGYAILLWIIGALRPGYSAPPESSAPRITIVVPAHNEESAIPRALNSIADVNYPPDLIEVIVVSDGSSDRTDDIVRSFSKIPVRLIKLEQRSGKNASLVHAYDVAAGEIIVTMDASSALHQESIGRLVGHFSDPLVGSCAGSKVIQSSTDSIAEGDGIYWKYEAMLRDLESRTGSSWVGVEGGLFAMRKSLIWTDFDSSLAQDFAVGCHINQRGYVNRYDPASIVYELPTVKAKSEFRKKVRVIVRGIKAFMAFRHLLNPFTNLNFCFQTISHKLFRWIVPFFLVAIFLTSAIGARNNPLALGLLAGQSLFYAFAAIGYVMDRSRITNRLFSVPLYFVVVNASCLVAWFFLSRDFSIWEPTKRGTSISEGK